MMAGRRMVRRSADSESSRDEGGSPRKAEERADRRTDILIAAERLFAGKGYAMTSVRDIASAAGVPIQLIRYHYGSKEGLYTFIFESHRGFIDERQQGILSVSAPPGPARVEAIIRAWINPVLQEHAMMRETSFHRLVAHTIWEAGEENRRITEKYYDPLAHCFIEAMKVALPEVNEATILWNYQFSLGALLIFIADDRVERLSKGSEQATDPARAEQLIDFIITGFLRSHKFASCRKPHGAVQGGR